MTQRGETSKRPAAEGSSSSSKSGATKRSRTIKGHASDCDDPECTGCADGAISLEADVLSLPAREITAMAEQEEAAGADRAVVAKLYETALEKFGDEASLPRAWALLRCAEFVEFSEYAAEALAISARVEAAQGLETAQKSLIQGRAHILLVCLDENNWRDPSEDSDEEDDDHEGAGFGASASIFGEDILNQGSEEIIDALQLIGGLGDKDAYDSAIRGALASLSARAERNSLTGMLRLHIMSIALKVVDTCVKWEDASECNSNSTADLADDIRAVASKVAVRWALAAADGMVSGEQIEATLKPAAAYLDSHGSDIGCCKLRAQMLIVLSSVLSDEDEAISAFDTAVEALKRAHQIDPEDEDVTNQLEDLGVDI
ncbi:hypothetical protein GQ54DRAFT_294851 [Martensiomyces pterosporus]|nr:hypothetical protein GQ54DRAFT_294851 [Martensiomyces pterosporus]